MNAITLIENFQRGKLLRLQGKTLFTGEFWPCYAYMCAYKLKREHYVNVCWKAFMTG